MNPHLAPVGVPDPALLPHVQQLCDLTDPYASGPAEDELFAAAMAEINAWHTERSPFFRSLYAATPAAEDGAYRTPLVHANFFKRHEVLSIPREDVELHLTSSGTTGQKSQMFFDHWTIRSAQRMVARIFERNGWITPEQEVNYLLYSYEPAPSLNLGTAFTDNYLCDFAPARSVEYALRNTGGGAGGDHEFDPFGCIAALRRFERDDAPVRILGFPAFLWFTLERMRATGVPPLRLPEGSLVVLGGGWKGHADRRIGKEELYARVTEQLGVPGERIRDTFGSVEHCIPYIECERHRLHAPVWSRVTIRSTRTLEPLPYGERGYLHLVSPYITSVPAQSVVMGDLASLQPGEACGCGLRTPWFTVHGRAGVSRNRSCAVAAAELMKGMA